MKTKRKQRKPNAAPEVAPSPQSAHVEEHDRSANSSREPVAVNPIAVEPAAVPCPLSRRVRCLISVALLFHLGAVFLAALRVPPVSQLAVSAAEGVQWYTNLVLVHPGYRFFAPDPDASQMLRVEIVAADGSQREETYPDLGREWPRLLYHRHFMLTSRMQSAPADFMSQALADSYARHVFAREGAQEVRIFRREHQLPSRDDVLKGKPLTDTSLYTTPYNSPVGKWTTAAGGPLDATRLELELRVDFTASLVGRVRGQMVRESWRWEPAPPPGPRRLIFFENADKVQFCSADVPEEHEMVLHYPLPGGVSRVAAIEHVPMRREPPPLVVYRGEQP